MLSRSYVLRSCRTARCTRKRVQCGPILRQKRFSSTSSAPNGHATQHASSVSPLGSLTAELDKLTPRFDVPASQIHIIRSPSEFYETLKAKILNAKYRIYLSTLYVGKTEYELISVIKEALERNKDLRVSILTDALRGTRETPNPSCATLLSSLIKDFGPERVEIRMYHTPNLTGLRKAILPKRINEGWGLQHMKLYGMDDEIIMSGANLSDDYFTNRQDRYHVISSKAVTDHFHRIYQTACRLSFQVSPSDDAPGRFTMSWPEDNAQPSPLVDPKGYIRTSTSLFAPLLQPPPDQPAAQTDTQIYPLVQLTPLLQPDTSSELPAISLVLRALARPELARSSWTFTAGYFNMTPDIRDLLLATRPSRGTVVAASPWANGFYGSKGVSGMLPAAYTYLSRQFLQTVQDRGLGENIVLKEWRKGTVNEPGGWTYHAKGLWITLAGEKQPSISLVGSSNYTKRSYSLDLEANALIVTRNEQLKQKLADEEAWLQEHAGVVKSADFEKTERRVGLHVRIAMWIVTLVGGAL